jgi:hypothetical protein
MRTRWSPYRQCARPLTSSIIIARNSDLTAPLCERSRSCGGTTARVCAGQGDKRYRPNESGLVMFRAGALSRAQVLQILAIRFDTGPFPADPNGNTLEISYGQEVTMTVEQPTGTRKP